MEELVIELIGLVDIDRQSVALPLPVPRHVDIGPSLYGKVRLEEVPGPAVRVSRPMELPLAVERHVVSRMLVAAGLLQLVGRTAGQDIGVRSNPVQAGTVLTLPLRGSCLCHGK